MEKNNKRFEKSITDWNNFIAGGRRYWWIMAIALIVSFGAYFFEVDARVDGCKYKVNSVIYVEMDYTNQVLPSLDNVLVWINSDVVWSQVNQMLQDERAEILSIEEKEVEGIQIGESDFFEISVCGKEKERTEQILENLLEVIVRQVETLEGIDGCRIISEGKAIEMDALVEWRDAIYIPVFGVLIGGGIIILISMFDRTIYSDYDLKLYFGRMYLGKIKKSDLRNQKISKRLINRFKLSKNDLLVANIETEMIQSEWAKNNMNICSINVISLEQLENINETSRSDVKVLLIVDKGISTCDDVNCFLEDIQAFGIELFGCLMVE